MVRISKIRKLEQEIREEFREKYIQVDPISFAVCGPTGVVLKGEDLTQAHAELESRVSERAYQKYAKKYLSTKNN
jgi:hypothetical protein